MRSFRLMSCRIRSCTREACGSGAMRAADLPADASLFEIVADYERRKIIEALEACNWSQTEAAEMLRIPLSTLNQKIKRLDIQIKRRGN